MCLYGLPRQPESEDAEEGLFEYVARLNGPLADYHPQMLLQCLLWGKVCASRPFSSCSLVNLDKLDVVKVILVNLSRDVERWHELHYDVFKSSTIPIDHYSKKSRVSSPVSLVDSCESDFLYSQHRRQIVIVERTLHCLRPQRMLMSKLELTSLISLLIHSRLDEDQGFSRSMIERLLSRLEAVPLPHLSPNEHAHLLVLIQAMLEVRIYAYTAAKS